MWPVPLPQPGSRPQMCAMTLLLDPQKICLTSVGDSESEVSTSPSTHFLHHPLARYMQSRCCQCKVGFSVEPGPNYGRFLVPSIDDYRDQTMEGALLPVALWNL